MVTIWVVKICKKNLLEIINYRLKERIKWKEFKSLLSEEKKDWGERASLYHTGLNVKPVTKVTVDTGATLHGLVWVIQGVYPP